MKNINLFSDKIVRIPFFSLDKYKAIPKEINELDRFIDALFYNEYFSEAVYLASPILHSEWEKIVNGNKERGKINETILKYYLRAISNTVPFGLFTTYSIVNNEIQTYSKDFERFSAIDMEYLLKLIHFLNEDTLIKRLVTFRKNNSIYKVGDKIRYIESQYVNDTISYTLSSIEEDELLTYLLHEVKNEITFEELKQEISSVLDGVSNEEIEKYVEELIQSGIYLSSLEISLNDSQSIKQILVFYYKNKEQIEKEENINYIFQKLINVDNYLTQLDEKVFNTKDIYEAIFSELAQIGIPFDSKYVINSNLKKNQTNMHHSVGNEKIEQLIHKLSKISYSQITPVDNLETFKKNFYARYEDQEVRLMEVLDNELGIGYLTTQKEDVFFSDLLDDITITPIKNTISHRKIEPEINKFWLNLFLKNANAKEIDLDQINFEVYKNEKSIQKGTFPLSYSYANDKIFLKYAAGSTATNLIGRFGNNDQQMQEVITKITDFEQHLNQDKITAEIIHLPSNRTGNILLRNVNRQAEISLLSKASEKNIVIDINDLYISIKRNRIVLRSAKLQKEVIPYLSSAQNFHYNSLPAYHFLCDLQMQDRFIDYGINFGGFNLEDLAYCPRLIFGDAIVVRSAHWVLRKETYKNSNDLKTHLNQLNIPQFIYLKENGEEKMIIDTTNEMTLSILWEEIKKRSTVQISECVYDMEERNQFANETIVFVQSQNDENSTKQVETYSNEEVSVKRSFILGDEWVYFKIYTGKVTSDTILLQQVQEMVNSLSEQKIIDKWFFIRYADPEFHIRIRFRLTNKKYYNTLTQIINETFKPLLEEKKIWKLDLSTYNRELERYLPENIENAETVFTIDSIFTLKVLSHLKSIQETKIWLYLLKAIDDLFTVFDVSLQERHQLSESLFLSFWKEHGEIKSIKKDINLKFRKYNDEIDRLVRTPLLDFTERVNQLQKIAYKPINKNVLASYIHMTVNRFVQSNPRAHEMILYGILERFYSKELGKRKYNQKLEKNEIY
ncbi:lantibiotic dehydratase [Flavobacterium sp.]|uniref:lantibiotic dehydratase n=1 Tax=Flavobacterium sp. TaxID=239 RepID=UPI0040476CA6